MNIDTIVKEIDQNLEDIARVVLFKRIEEEKNPLFRLMQKQFFIELDSPSQHQQRWHQWGIITHTRQFLKFYDTLVQEDLKKWNISEKVNRHLSIQIDGIAKSKLIRLGILLHDIGKFQKNYKLNSNLKISAGFKDHELYSYQIIKGELFSLLAKEYKLSDRQIEYIAMCAKYHFELGIIREVAKKSPQGYTIEFVKSTQFRESIVKSIPKFGDYKVEVGVLFLADSYAKSNIEYRDRTDREILDELKNKQLNPKLIHSIKQIPINIEVAKRYFLIL
jgi:CRISPR/Cas system-associated endonuclease Cas3-HD